MSDTDSDDDDLMNMEFPSQTIYRRQNQPKKPEPGFIWKENAIQECMNLAILSHNNEETVPPSAIWEPPPTTCTKNITTPQSQSASWKARDVSLPMWAVDPLCQQAKNTDGDE